MTLSLRQKLLGMAVFGIVMLLITSVVAIIASEKASERTERLYNNQVMGLNELGNVRWYVALIRTAAIRSTVTRGDQLQEQLRLGDERKAMLVAAMDRFHRIPLDVGSKALVDRLGNEMDAYLTVRGNVVRHAALGQQAEAQRVMNQFATGAFQKVVATCDQLSDQALRDARHARAQADHAALVVRNGLIGMMILVVAGFLTLSLRISGGILRQIRAMTGTMSEVAAGDLSVSVTVTAKDELGDLATRFNWLVGELRGVLVQVVMSSSLLNDTATQLSDSMGQASHASEDMSRTVEQLATGSSSQADAVQQGANESVRMSETADQVTRRVDEVDRMADTAASAAASGRSSLDVAVGKIHDLHATVTGGVAAVRQLGEQSRQIGMIIEMIRGIATQTNLLALNAAIEAARAGEHGRGFAVVAEEVRKLAVESASSAGQITEMITQIQSDTDHVVALMARSLDEAGTSSQLIDAASLSFAEVQTSIAGTHHGVAAIASGIRTLSDSLRVVSGTMENIASVAEENAASSEEVSASVQQQMAMIQTVAESAHGMSGMAEDMKQVASRFKLRDREERLALASR
jgi:methyl-accepting chemotaxis protein